MDNRRDTTSTERGSTLKILDKPDSIDVRKVLWLREELGAPHELEAYSSGHRQTDSPEFRALNPNALVPVVLDGDVVLWESNTICRYLPGRHDLENLLPHVRHGRNGTP